MAVVVNTKTNEWTLSADHVVTYVSTTYYEHYAGRQDKWTETNYQCSCGSSTDGKGSAKKVIADAHDTWNEASALESVMDLLLTGN